MPDRWFPSIGITVSYFPECWFPKARTLVSRVPEYSFIAGTSFEDITLHSLRHANATFMLAGGVDLKLVSAILGHSSIATTANIYTDVLDRAKLTAAQVVAEQLTG